MMRLQAVVLFLLFYFINCKLVDVAVGKKATTTSGVYGDWLPSGAVDGDKTTLDADSSCFHATTSPSDWTVDLGKEYQLYDIKVYLRTEYLFRTANSKIYLDNNASRVCYTFPPTIWVNPTHLTCNERARYITIRNPGRDSINDLLNICEVEIYVCSSGSYGKSCDHACNCLFCDRWTGICSGDCESGWHGQRCDKECNGTYGTNCKKSCAVRRCNNSSTCDVVDGSCDRGCLSGWIGTDCIKECAQSTYGVNCSSLCSERHCAGESSCHHVTGACDKGCHAGWRGVDCTKACDNDHYGQHCISECAARQCEGNSSCDFITGRCDGGCKSRWAGVDCSRCNDLYYGDNCSKPCEDSHCLMNSSCDYMTGSCDNGCEPGWRGQQCTQRCEREHYGPNCALVCADRYCLQGSSCPPSTGRCDHGCQTGRAGTDCTEEARDTSAIIAGSVIGVALIIAVTIVIIVILWMKRYKAHEEPKMKTVSLSNISNSVTGHEADSTDHNNTCIDSIHQVEFETNSSRQTEPEELANYETLNKSPDNVYIGLKDRKLYENM